MKLNQNALINFLKTRNITAKVQDETEQLYYLLETKDRQHPVFLRIMEDGNMLQLLGFVPVNFNDNTVGDTARLLHMLNRELDVPGFGMEEQSKTVFYRIMMPAMDNNIDEKLIGAYLDTIKLVMSTFSPAVEAVASGQMSLGAVLDKVREATKQV